MSVFEIACTVYFGLGVILSLGFFIDNFPKDLISILFMPIQMLSILLFWFPMIIFAILTQRH